MFPMMPLQEDAQIGIGSNVQLSGERISGQCVEWEPGHDLVY